MTTKPRWTLTAITAYLSDQALCHDCGGSGRDTGGRRNSCRSCRGAGVPLDAREAVALGFSRHGWKAARQVTR